VGLTGEVYSTPRPPSWTTGVGRKEQEGEEGKGDKR